MILISSGPRLKCLAFFGFLRSEEFAAETSTTPTSIQASGVSVHEFTHSPVCCKH